MIQLHVHSTYSPMDGLLSLEEIIELTKINGDRIVSLTDTLGVYGQHHFVELCRENELLPIIGFYLRSPAESVFLAKGRKGQPALFQLISMVHSGCSLGELVSFLGAHENEIIVLSDDLKFLSLLISKNRKNLYVEWTPGLFNHELQTFAKKYDLSLVGSYRVRFKEKKDFYYYELLRAIDENLSYRDIFEKKN